MEEECDELKLEVEAAQAHLAHAKKGEVKMHETEKKLCLHFSACLSLCLYVIVVTRIFLAWSVIQTPRVCVNSDDGLCSCQGKSGLWRRLPHCQRC